MGSRNGGGFPLIELSTDISGFFRERLEGALARRGVAAGPLTQVYLVHLLAEHGSGFAPEKMTGTLGGTLVERMAEAADILEPAERLRRFREIGDAALYAAGFFGDHLSHRGIAKSYVVMMGGRAYDAAGSLARRPHVVAERAMAEVYPELSGRFESFAAVLDDVRESTEMRTPQDIVKLYERWKRTGSSLLAERLQEEGVFPQRERGNGSVH